MGYANSKELGAVVNDVAMGVASEKDTSMVMKTLQMSMTLKLANGLSDILNKLDSQSALVDRAMDKYAEMLEQKIDTDTVEMEELMDFVNNNQQKSIQIMEIYRRCLQNGNLFDSETQSAEERLVLNMLRSLKTPEDKKKFYEACKGTGLFD